MSEIRGIGVDLCEISRMREILENTRLLERCFTDGEQAWIRAKNAGAAETLAGLWAAKEAAAKALGTGVTFPMTDIEVTHTESGQPQYLLHGKAAELAGNGTMLLSISHDGGIAAAFCVWQKK